MAAEGRHRPGVMADRQSGHVVVTHSSSSALEGSRGAPVAVPLMLTASHLAVLAPRDLEQLLAPACLGHSCKRKATGAQVGRPTSVCPGHRPSSATAEKVPAVQDTAGHLLAQLL